MARADERGIVDQSALRMREATLAAGVYLTYVVCGSSVVYVAATWSQPHRTILALLFGLSVVSAAVISLLPAERIVRSRYREPFFLSWSILDLALIICAAIADGGTGSPLALIFFTPIVFSATTYPLRSVAVVAGLTVASYATLAVTVGGAGWGYQSLFAVMLLCTGAISAWQARNHERQRQDLMEVSRADPLTGCLNRRGFEERAVAEIGAATRSGRGGAVLLLDIDHFKEVNDHHGHAAGDELLRWVVDTLRRVVRPSDAIGRLGGDEFAVVFSAIEPADALESLSRIRAALAERAPCSLGMATFPMDGVDLEELVREADTRLYASRNGRPDRDPGASSERLAWAASLAHAVDMRMNASHDHSRAVAEWAVVVARAIGWDEGIVGNLRIAAMLHDIGKVTIPDSVLCKPGALSAQEFDLVKGHSVAGAALVSQIDGLELIVPWIRHSHEHYDGSGYPDGLSGDAIPLASRIILVADAFDAITSARPYREAQPREHACEELARGAGTQFDPACVRALLRHLRANEALAQIPA